MTRRTRIPDDRIAQEIERDAAAYREATSRGLPELSAVARAARTRATASKEGFVMALARRHPFLAPAAMTVAVLFVVLLLPISFDRTVGHDVSMRLTGGSLDARRIGAIAEELKAQLGADAVQVTADVRDGAETFDFAASVPAKGGASAKGVVAAFERMLEAQGVRVAAAVTPRVEKVSGTVAAYAADRVIRIETEGKSAAQIESELRAAFEAAGMTGVQVSVTDEGPGKHRIEVKAEKDANSGDPEGAEPPRIIVGDGSAGDGKHVTIQVRKLKDDTGALTMKLDIGANGRETEVTVPNPDALSDGALEAEIESQLARAGVDLDVTVTGGKIDVETP